jgi:bacillopeptidase F
MPVALIRRTVELMAWTLWLSLLGIPAQAAVIEPGLEAAIRSGGVGEEFSVIATFRNRIDPQAFNHDDRRQQRFQLLRALKREADGLPEQVRHIAEERGANHVRSLWAGHAMAFSGGPALLRDLAALPGIESIRTDHVARVFTGQRGGHPVQPQRSGLPSLRKPRLDSNRAWPGPGLRSQETGMQATPISYASTVTPEWNLDAVKGPDLWALGFKGARVVVASLDTGVDGDHPDLAAQYRGGTNSWYDPHGEHPTIPTDKDGHGTHAMSLAVGRASGGSAIGMAPDAQWVAVKMFNDAGLSRESVMHQSLQWVLDPDGDISTDDAPDVVNLSWAVATANVCNRAFQDELDLLRASGIAVVMSAGNSGPAVSTSISPANNPGQMSVGSVDSRFTVSTFSSRGPSACDGGLFPVLVAPGEQVLAADLSFGGMPFYATISGTSFAAPHVAGAMALLISAVPTATLPVLESALKASAVLVGANGTSSRPVVGMIDTLAAYHAVLTAAGSGSLGNEEKSGAGESLVRHGSRQIAEDTYRP